MCNFLATFSQEAVLYIFGAIFLFIQLHYNSLQQVVQHILTSFNRGYAVVFDNLLYFSLLAFHLQLIYSFKKLFFA